MNNTRAAKEKTVSGPIKMVFEDITQEKLSWLVECVDEMFSDLDENDTY
jgi:hypothetical protein